jgi:hypothetical protein
MRRINANPAVVTVQNYLTAVNAFAEQQRKVGNPTEFLTAKNAPEVYKKYIKASMALADGAHPKHKEAFNAFSAQFGRHSEQMDNLIAIGEKFIYNVKEIARSAHERGMAANEAAEFAFNSVAGNPVFDHFGNLNLLAGQLYEEQTFVEAFLESGDAMAVPIEEGGTGIGMDISRFRVPVEQVTGSAKIAQGDINPAGHSREDVNRTQISLFNEFKNCVTLEAEFSITGAQRDQALGYERSVAPALAGFILQNRYFAAAQKQVLKIAETMFVGGLDSNANYTQGVGGSYGILSSSIWLALASANAEAPLPATAADWTANPTKLIQKLVNYFYKPTSVTAPLSSAVDSALMYKDIVRLFTVIAQANVDFSPREWCLFVPSSWYALAMQYPSGGTFNKQLQEMVDTATGGKIIKKISVLPSSLLNYGANIGNGTNGYNYMVAVAMGAPQEKKPVIMPGQTAIPTIISENVSPARMDFRSLFPFGGPMVLHFGGAVVLEFSVAA